MKKKNRISRIVEGVFVDESTQRSKNRARVKRERDDTIALRALEIAAEAAKETDREIEFTYEERED